MKREQVLSVDNLVFGYASRNVLDGLSIDFETGKFSCIVGPNGAGKTTLVKLLSGVLGPKSGEIHLKGKPLISYSKKEIAKVMATVHQSSHYYFDFTVKEFVLMGRYPHQKWMQSESKEDVLIAQHAMERMGVLAFADKSISAISGGELQRVHIARALAQEPEILLLDEPVSHLDLRYQVELMKIFRSLKDIAVIATIHDLNLAAKYADEVAVIADGKVASYGLPAEVITANMLSSVYGVDAEVIDRGYPHIFLV